MSKKYKKIAYSFVMADLLHYGHIKLLKTARKNADYHICGLISDEICHIWQGINICNYKERKAVIESLTFVDKVMKQDSMDPTENIKIIRKKYPGSQIIVIHGDDWKTIPGREFIESIGARIIQPEYYAQLSRDVIIKKFRESTPYHPLKHEYFTREFNVGNIVQFSQQSTNKLISTKANTLKTFKSLLKLSKIEKLFICTVKDFKAYPNDIIDSIKRQFKRNIIVRSSCFNEDGYNVSNAGCFESISNIDSQNTNKIENALNTVIKSYEKAYYSNPHNQLLVQNQTTDVIRSGVIFTRNLGNNSPYYIVNYDETGKTNTVTSGEESKCAWLHKNGNISHYPKKWQKLINVTREIENKLPGMILDIEFAEKRNGDIIIYQIRPLAANVRCEEFDDKSFKSTIKDNIEKYRNNPERINNSRAFLSDMAFWNPSEIIGDNPHPLDYSIYRELITMKAWNTGITWLGYSYVDHNLMEKYGNKPYINLDYAFHSLIPEVLKKDLKHKLVKYYKRKLKNDLTAHDKIEFEIALSCYDFETDDKLLELASSSFSNHEIKEISRALQLITISIIRNYRTTLKNYRNDLKRLKTKTERIIARSQNKRDYKLYISCVLSILQSICELGTPQFSAIARIAFISKAICKSLVIKGYYSASEMNSFMESISTVATEFDKDFYRYASCIMNRKEFLGKYGHLRAGTYDIRALRYDQMDFSCISIKNEDRFTKVSGTKKNLDKDRLENILKDSVFSSITPDDFLFFLKSSIEQREYFKFEFTRSLSNAIELLVKAGDILGFSRNELSYLDLEIIKSINFYSDRYNLTDAWKKWIEINMNAHSDNALLVFPPVIRSEVDFEVIILQSARPNFIGESTVVGEVVDLDSGKPEDLTTKIILLTKADPGFDWIFTKGIKGLITKYGGAASHMAIRCAEFNVPAAIGCGEQIYKKVSQWEKIEINCKTKMIKPFFNYNA
jgi:cytidyltransferase-like protein